MADAADSKSATRKGVKVRLLSPAPIQRWFLFFRKSPRRSHFHGYLNRFNMTPLLSLRQKTRSYAPPTCAPCCLNHCPAWASHFVSANKRGGTIREGLHRIAAWLGDSVFLRSQGDGRPSVESGVLDQRMAQDDCAEHGRRCTGRRQDLSRSDLRHEHEESAWNELFRGDFLCQSRHAGRQPVQVFVVVAQRVRDSGGVHQKEHHDPFSRYQLPRERLVQRTKDRRCQRNCR